MRRASDIAIAGKPAPTGECISSVGGGLLPMAASGPTRMLDWTGYISVSAVTAAMGSAFTAAHF
ncbi:hypothetical protein CUU62_14590 [Pseudomonas sp. WP001]|uniref:Uncharacterized protein n=1 Tax=Pseudomonas orientalis TaxID=76758 RepID=A0A4Q7CTB9_9PSED|nr:hypothetical protein CUU62_14590 [Pseudomonas sp. WP001]RZI18780.1 hypothetical protein EUX57_27515 [Pseudomonas orientalis]